MKWLTVKEMLWLFREEPRKIRKVAHMKKLNQRQTSDGQVVTPVPVNVVVSLPAASSIACSVQTNVDDMTT